MEERNRPLLRLVGSSLVKGGREVNNEETTLVTFHRMGTHWNLFIELKGSPWKVFLPLEHTYFYSTPVYGTE